MRLTLGHCHVEHIFNQEQGALSAKLVLRPNRRLMEKQNSIKPAIVYTP